MVILETGQLVKVVKNNSRHNFGIGEVVRFVGIEISDDGAENKIFEHLDGHDWWYMDAEEFEPIINH